ncbi:MAG: hypothetical protein ACOVP4_13935 [Bacteriovoracaceae bacterium]
MKKSIIALLALSSISAFSSIQDFDQDYSTITERTICTVSKLSGGDCRTISDGAYSYSNALYKAVLNENDSANLSEVELFEASLAVCAQLNAAWSARPCGTTHDDLKMCTRALLGKVFTNLDYDSQIQQIIQKATPERLIGVGLKCN